MGLYPNKNLLSELVYPLRCLRMEHLAVEDVLNQLLRALSFKKKNRTKQFYRVKDTLSFPHPVRINTCNFLLGFQKFIAP